MAQPRQKRNRNIKIDMDIVAWLKSNFEVKAGNTVERRLVYKAYVGMSSTTYNKATIQQTTPYSTKFHQIPRNTKTNTSAIAHVATRAKL